MIERARRSTTPLPGPKAKAIIERDRTVVSPSYTRGYPLVIERGSGAMVEDVDGNIFLDCAAGIAVNSTGHSHPDVVRAITEQAQKFLHMSGTDFYYEPQVRLAEELAVDRADRRRRRGRSSATPGPRRSKPASSWRATRPAARTSSRFSARFHGRTMGALSLTASKAIQRRGFGPMMPGVYHAPYPDRYRCPLGATPETLRGRVRRLHRASAVHAARVARRSRRDRRRADPGRRRLHRARRRVPRSGCAS